MVYRLEASLYIPVFNRGGATERSHYRTIAFLPHARKVMLKGTLSFCLIWSKKCQKFKLDSEKEEALRSNCEHLLGTSVPQRISKEGESKSYLRSKAFDCVDDEML